MEEDLIVAAGISDGKDEGLAFGHDCHVGYKPGIEYVVKCGNVSHCVIRNATYPGPWSGPGYMNVVVAQRIVQASVSTERKMPSISSNSFWPAISGGASCTTGSPRSSARQ